MEIKAIQKFVRMSPRKLRLVTPLVKGLTPKDAIDRLPLSGKRAALPIAKVIKTAMANAKQKGIGEQDLILKEIQINEGPRLKRWRAGARGRVKPYQRKMSHIRVVLASKEAKITKRSGRKTFKKEDLKEKSKKPKVVNQKKGKKDGTKS